MYVWSRISSQGGRGTGVGEQAGERGCASRSGLRASAGAAFRSRLPSVGPGWPLPTSVRHTPAPPPTVSLSVWTSLLRRNSIL